MEVLWTVDQASQLEQRDLLIFIEEEFAEGGVGWGKCRVQGCWWDLNEEGHLRCSKYRRLCKALVNRSADEVIVELCEQADVDDRLC